MADQILTTTQPDGTILYGLNSNRETVGLAAKSPTSLGLFANLTQTWWVDAQQAVNGNGNVESPFNTMQAGANAIPDGSGGAPSYGNLIVAATNHAEAPTFTTFRFMSVTSVNFGAQFLAGSGNQPTALCNIDSVSVVNHAEIQFQGFNIGSLTLDTARVTVVNTNVGGFIGGAGAEFKAFALQAHAPGSATERFTLAGAGGLANFQVFGYVIGADLLCNDPARAAIVQQCELQGTGHTVGHNGGGPLYIDMFSKASASRNGVNLVGTPINVIECPTTRVPSFPIPNFAGAGVQYVHTTCPGARPGDSFHFAWSLGGLSPLLTLTIGGGAYCVTNDFVEVPLIATAATGSSTSFDLIITRFPLAGVA